MINGPCTWAHIGHPANSECPGFRIADADDHTVVVAITEEKAVSITAALNRDWFARMSGAPACAVEIGVLEGILSRLTTLKGMAIQMRDTAANDDWRMYRDGQAEAFGDAINVVRRAMAGDKEPAGE